MALTSEHRALIDESLQTFALYEQKRISNANILSQTTPTLENLRQSLLGQHLEQLAEIAEQGLTSMGRAQAKGILEEVYELLFKGPFQERPFIPASFDATLLGQLLYQARARILDLQDVMNVTEASKQSGIARAHLYMMIDMGVIHPINMNNRLMIERSELERIAKERQQTTKED